LCHNKDAVEFTGALLSLFFDLFYDFAVAEKSARENANVASSFDTLIAAAVQSKVITTKASERQISANIYFSI